MAGPYRHTILKGNRLDSYAGTGLEVIVAGKQDLACGEQGWWFMSISTELIQTLDAIPWGVPDAGSPSPTGTLRPGAMPRGTPRYFAPQNTLFREGVASSEVFMIVTGIVKLVRHLPNGRARIVGLHGPGAVLGMFSGRPSQYLSLHSAVTLGPVATECWSRSRLQQLRRERPDNYIDLLERFHEQASQADLWITEFSTGRIKSRVARLVLFLERIEAGLSQGEVELLTCQEMGEILGITPESVSRVIAGMKREHLLVHAPSEKGESFSCDRLALQEIAGD